MLADDHFLAIFDRITRTRRKSRSFFERCAGTRGQSAAVVLAISRIMGELKADAELPDAVRASDEHARAME